MKDAAEKRTIAIEECGSIAEASLRLSGVFERAQEAADLYLANIARMEEELRERLKEGSAYEEDPYV